MAIAPRGSQFRIAYDPLFTPQSAIGTPNATATLTAVLQVTTRNHIALEQKFDDVYDCSGQFKVTRNQLSRLARLQVEFDASPLLVKGFLGACMGKPTGTLKINMGMLPIAEFQPPYLTFVVGFDEGTDTGVLFHSVVVNSFKIMSKSRERIHCSMELIGSGNLTATSGFSYPACSTVVPIYPADGALTINGVNALQANDAAGTSTVEFNLDYSNNLLVSDDPWQLAQIDPTRIERADRRTIMFDWKVEGQELDATHAAAIASPSNQWPVIWRIGTTLNNVLLTATKCILSGEGNVQGFEGEAARAVLNLKLEPILDGATLPLVGLATIPA